MAAAPRIHSFIQWGLASQRERRRRRARTLSSGFTRAIYDDDDDADECDDARVRALASDDEDE